MSPLASATFGRAQRHGFWGAIGLYPVAALGVFFLDLTWVDPSGFGGSRRRVPQNHQHSRKSGFCPFNHPCVDLGQNTGRQRTSDI